MIAAGHTVTLYVDHAYGATVHLKLRQERMPGMVTGFLVRSTGLVYLIAWGDGSESSHFDVELTDSFTPDFETTTGN
jgi:hypothetical protein